MTEQDINYVEAVRAKTENACLKHDLAIERETVKILTTMNIELNGPCPYSDEREPTFKEAFIRWGRS